MHLTLKERYVLWHAPFPPSGITLQNLLYKRWFLWVSKYNYHLFSDQVRRGVGQFLIWRHALHTLQACLHRRNAACINLWCQITNTPSNSVRKQMTLSSSVWHLWIVNVISLKKRVQCNSNMRQDAFYKKYILWLGALEEEEEFFVYNFSLPQTSPGIPCFFPHQNHPMPVCVSVRY